MNSLRHTALALALATLPAFGLANTAAQAVAPAPAAEALADSADKRALIAELMRVTGAIEIGNQVAGTMAQNFKQQLPPEMHAVVDEIFGDIDMREIEGELIALYARTFTEQELADILAFYQTPSGRSMLAKTPALMQESMAIGQAWGARKAEAVITRLQAQAAAKRDDEAAEAAQGKE